MEVSSRDNTAAVCVDYVVVPVTRWSLVRQCLSQPICVSSVIDMTRVEGAKKEMVTFVYPERTLQKWSQWVFYEVMANLCQPHSGIHLGTYLDRVGLGEGTHKCPVHPLRLVYKSPLAAGPNDSSKTQLFAFVQQRCTFYCLTSDDSRQQEKVQ